MDPTKAMNEETNSTKSRQNRKKLAVDWGLCCAALRASAFPKAPPFCCKTDQGLWVCKSQNWEHDRKDVGAQPPTHQTMPTMSRLNSQSWKRLKHFEASFDARLVTAFGLQFPVVYNQNLSTNSAHLKSLHQACSSSSSIYSHKLPPSQKDPNLAKLCLKLQS